MIYELTVASAYGSPTPPVGIHSNHYGTVVTNTVDALEIQDATQYVSVGWTMAGHDPAAGSSNSFSMTVTNDAVLNWQWETSAYYWGVTSAPGGSVQGTESGWYSPGTVVSNLAVPRDDCRFRKWSGAPAGLATDNPLVHTLDGGYPDVRARFRSLRPGGFLMQIIGRETED